MKPMRNAGWFAGLALVVTAAAFGRGGATCGEPLSLQRGCGSLPAGVVLEGEGAGLDPVKTVTYDREKHEFVLDEKIRYACPVDLKDFLDLLRALAEDDRVGVSITSTNDLITYGKIKRKSPVAQALFDTDRFLSGLVFGQEEYYKGIELPGNFKPDRIVNPEPPMAATFVCQGNLFGVLEDRVRVTSGDIAVLVAPLSKKRAPDGGHLVDEEVLKEGKFDEPVRRNLEWIRLSKAEILKMPIPDKARRLSEAAAFIRHLQKSGIDLKAFAKTLS